jgi:hypothetical protein
VTIFSLLSSFYVFAIIFIGSLLFAAVGRLEPNRRLATALKCALVVTGGMAIASQLLAGQ